MRVLLLCAGLGTRLRPLTDTTPKPLLTVAGKSLLERHLEKLALAGFRQVVVNTAYLGEQIEQAVGSGSRWGLTVRISREGKQPLETGGAIRHALPLLGPAPFLLLNSDILCDFPLQQLRRQRPEICHLVLVPNPDHNSAGDFSLDGSQLDNTPQLTYSGIGVFQPRIVARQAAKIFSIVPLIRQAAAAGSATGERWDGLWLDIGAPDRLARAEKLLGR